MTSEIQCPVHWDGLCPDVVRATEQLRNLTGWQENQNGHLRRIDEKLGKMEHHIDAQANRLQWWLIGLLSSAVLAVALLAVNLASKRI